jgi:outer membrane protein
VPYGGAVSTADTLNGALIDAYQRNPQLNSQRAVVRETDESVPQALSGYKPTLSAIAQFGEEYSSTVAQTTGPRAIRTTPVPVLVLR